MTRHTATKRHRRSMKRMTGGMTTGEHGIGVYGNTNQQMAIGNGSNVIRMNDVNAQAPMQGGRKRGGGLIDNVGGLFNKFNQANDKFVKSADAVAQSADSVSKSVDSAAQSADAVIKSADSAAQSNSGLFGGKKRRKGLLAIPNMLLDMTPLRSERKSAKKHRKSIKKGKTAKRRAHKRR